MMKILCLDIETIGLDSNVDEILQFSAINESNFEFDKYYKPQFHEEWPDVEAINNISSNMVNDKENFYTKENIAAIQKLVDKADLLIGYNIWFDIGFLEAAGIDCTQKKKYDVMIKFAEIYGEVNEYYNDYIYQKLTTCASYYSYDWSLHDHAHNSLADCYATLYC